MQMTFPPYNIKAVNFHEKLYCTFSHVVIVVMENHTELKCSDYQLLNQCSMHAPAYYINDDVISKNFILHALAD